MKRGCSYQKNLLGERAMLLKSLAIPNLISHLTKYTLEILVKIIDKSVREVVESVQEEANEE